MNANAPDPPVTPAPAAENDRPLRVVFGVMLVVALFSWSLSWRAPILDRHEFRQLQTAVTAHWMKQDGFRLDYETPLFGPPSWSIPMEFPVYQWCVAQLSRFTGLALDQSGRATSILFLLATLPAIGGLAGLAGCSRGARLLVIAAVLSSPVYLFYGRAFMIESTALCFATWFLYALARAVRDVAWSWAIATAAWAVLAALAKVTTFAVFCFPAAGLALWLGWPHWQDRQVQSSRWLWAALYAAVPVLLAVWIGRAWVHHADLVKDANPYSGFLKSTEMVAWNWGTLDQRLSTDVWLEVWNNVRQFVLSEPSLVLLLVCVTLASCRPRAWALAAAGAFLVGPLLFTNLYYRHDYYYSANAVLLLGGAGFLLAGMWQSPALARKAKYAILVLFFGSQLAAFYRGYGYNHRRELPSPPDIATVIRESVPPDGVVVIYGWDWDSLVPYYAQRRAIMVPGGREEEFKVLEDVLGQLPPRRVAGLLIKQRVPTPFPPSFIQDRLSRFSLVPAPFATSADGDLYLPADAFAAAAEKLRSRTFPRATINTAASVANPDGLEPRDLAGLDLRMTSPRPSSARAKFALQVGDDHGKKVIFAHPISELHFSAPAGANEIEAEFGIVDAAYAAGSGAVTDGVGFEIVELRPDGRRRQLYQRELHPASTPADRGPQQIRLAGLGALTGTLVFRTTPGPSDNLVNDWAYWGAIRIGP